MGTMVATSTTAAKIDAGVLLAETEKAVGYNNPILAFNLSGISDSSPQLPFLDLGKTMRPFFASSPTQWEAMKHAELSAGGYLDENGWPTAIPPGMSSVKTIWAESQGGGAPAASRAGTYVLTYEGEGTVKIAGKIRLIEQGEGYIVFENENGGSFWFDILSTDPAKTGNYIRNISVVPEEYVDLHEAGAIFNPEWLSIVGDSRQFRFMDWMHTNGSSIDSWDDRPQLDDATWRTHGVPLEIMVQLANEAGADPWFTMPHMVDDEYVRNFATYVRDNLDPGLHVHVEYSNEAWNFAFPQTHWMMNEADAQWNIGSSQPNTEKVDFQAKRATEIALIWDEVFGAEADERVVNVLGTHTANAWNTRRLLDPQYWAEAEPDAYVPPTEVFDAIAVTTYFGSSTVSDTAKRSELLAAIADPTVDAMKFLHDRLMDPGYSWSIPFVKAKWLEHKAFADAYGMDLIAYEGGQHVHHSFAVTGLTDAEVTALTSFMTEFVRSEYMAALYDALWEAWKDVGDGPFIQFGDVGVPSRWGSWAILSHLGDSNPRAELIFALNEAETAWWETRGETVFQNGVTLNGTDAADTLIGTQKTDYLAGGAGDDILVPGRGADGIHGGDGFDTAVLAGLAGDYAVSAEGEGLRIRGAGSDLFAVSVESFVFRDGSSLSAAAFLDDLPPVDPPPVDPPPSVDPPPVDPPPVDPPAERASLFDLRFGAGTVVDASGHGTIVDFDPSRVRLGERDGKTGYDLGSDNAFEISRKNGDIFGLDAFTIELSFARASATGGTGSLFRLHQSKSLTLEKNGELAFGFIDASGTAVRMVTKGAALDDVDWHHVVVSYDSAEARLALYVDGVALATAAASGDTKAAASWGLASGNPFGTNFTGLVGDFRREATAMEAADVAAAHAAHLASLTPGAVADPVESEEPAPSDGRVESYLPGTQDFGTAAVEDGGDRIVIGGNAWKAVSVDMEVTPDSVITFGFGTPKLGEIHAIGFETDGKLPETQVFQLAGTQSYGVQAFRSATAGVEASEYVIPVGEYFTGDVDRIVFIADDDRLALGVSEFEAVTFWENGLEDDSGMQKLLLDSAPEWSF